MKTQKGSAARRNNGTGLLNNGTAPLKPTGHKRAHIVRVTHRDQVEPPISDWLREAYDFADPATAHAARKKPSQRGGK